MLIRLPEVERLTGLKKTELYRLIRAAEFPIQVPLGKRAVAWSRDEVEAWVQKVIAARAARNHASHGRSAIGRQLAEAKRQKAEARATRRSGGAGKKRRVSVTNTTP